MSLYIRHKGKPELPHQTWAFTSQKERHRHTTRDRITTYKTLWSGLSCWWKVRERPNRVPGSPSFLRIFWGSRLKASTGSRTCRSSSAAWACSSMAARFSTAGPERTAAGLPPSLPHSCSEEAEGGAAACLSGAGAPQRPLWSPVVIQSIFFLIETNKISIYQKIRTRYVC